MHIFTASDTYLHVYLLLHALAIAGYKSGNRINIAVVLCFIKQLDPQPD